MAKFIIDNGLAYIRNYYRVPAYKDFRVKWRDKIGVIVGSSGPHIKVLFDDEKNASILHPQEEGLIYIDLALFKI